MSSLFQNPRLPFVAACVICFGLVGGGVLMAQLLNLAACPLCILQRMLYLLLGSVSVIGIVAASSHIGRRILAEVMAGIAATGLFVAGYQVWIQRFARETNCSADQPWWEHLVDWAGARVPLLFQANGLCSDPAWKFLGLSIAEWSLIAFGTLLALAVFAATRRRAA